MRRLGKTSPDREYSRGEMALLHAQKTKRKQERYKASSGAGTLGETRFVHYKGTGLKERIREVSDARRENRTPENMAELDALFIEARAAGWSLPEIGRAARSGRERVASRLAYLDSATN